jgi:multiple sugar transport system permease protein
MAAESIVQEKKPAVMIVTAVVLLVFFLWSVMPLFIMLISSIKTQREAFALPEIGDIKGAFTAFFKFKPTGTHYRELIINEGFWTYIWHGLVASIGSALISVSLGTLGAFGLSRGRFKQEENISFWIISTRMAPAVVVIVPLYYIFRRIGVLQTLPGLVLAYTTFNLPFALWLIKGFFDDIPVEIEEAAFVDGDTHWKVFGKIALPLAKPGIVSAFVLCVLLSWNDFLFAAILGGAPAKTVPVGITELQTTSYIKWGPINAATIILVVPMIFLGILIRKYLVQGLTMGAVRE